MCVDANFQILWLSNVPQIRNSSNLKTFRPKIVYAMSFVLCPLPVAGIAVLSKNTNTYNEAIANMLDFQCDSNNNPRLIKTHLIGLSHTFQGQSTMVHFIHLVHSRSNSAESSMHCQTWHCPSVQIITCEVFSILGIMWDQKFIVLAFQPSKSLNCDKHQMTSRSCEGNKIRSQPLVASFVLLHLASLLPVPFQTSQNHILLHTLLDYHCCSQHATHVVDGQACGRKSPSSKMLWC